MYLANYVSKANFDDGDIDKSIRLGAVASLVLAAYREEFEFELSHISVDNYKFSEEDISQKEFEILEQCYWEIRFTNPFQFTQFFVGKFCPNLRDPVPRIKKILASIIRDVNVMHERASILTLAAIIHLVCEDDERRSYEEVTESFVTVAHSLGLDHIGDGVSHVCVVIKRKQQADG